MELCQTSALPTLLPNCTALEEANPSVLGQPRFPDDLTEALPVQWWNVTVQGVAQQVCYLLVLCEPVS